MKIKGMRWLVACVLVAYYAILIKIIVFKAIPTIRVGHLLRLRFAGPHTGPANLIPFRTVSHQLLVTGVS
jgi:glycopeptide antibiotics resistance protein